MTTIRVTTAEVTKLSFCIPLLNWLCFLGLTVARLASTFVCVSKTSQCCRATVLHMVVQRHLDFSGIGLYLRLDSL